MVNELNWRQNYNRDKLAEVLDVCPSTLPFELECERVPKQSRGFSFRPLDDEEWKTVASVLPKLPVPKPEVDYQDRTFIDSVLWWVEARARGFSWHRLPEELGPASSREHRHRRWVVLSYWSEVATRLSADGRLGRERLQAFVRIAEAATLQRARILDRRARLTDAIRSSA